GRPDAARGIAEHVLARSPDDFGALLLRAICVAHDDRPADAASDLESALVQAPWHAGARRLLARVRCRQAELSWARGDGSGAVDALVGAVGLADLDVRAALALARIVAADGASAGAARERARELASALDRRHPRSAAAPLLVA